MPKIAQSNSILKIEGIDLTFTDTFNQVLTNFLETETRVFHLLETIILSCVLVEAIIKSQLKKINPTLILDKIDSETIALVSNKTKRLLAKPTCEISDVKTASITVLMERFSKFKDITPYQAGLRKFFDLRNKIVHSADNVSLQENEISILLTKYVFPFIKEYVNVNQRIWQDIEKISHVAHDHYRRNLVKGITEHRRAAEKLKPEEVDKRIASKLTLEKTESVEKEDLVCPACYNPSMVLINGVDVEYEGGEIVPHGYKYGICKVCGLKLDFVEQEELIKQPRYYFAPSDEQLSDWQKAVEEPDYSDAL